MYCLYQNRVNSRLLSEDGSKLLGEEVMDIPLRQQSEKEIVQQLYKNDIVTREVSLFLLVHSEMHTPFLWFSEMKI